MTAFCSNINYDIFCVLLPFHVTPPMPNVSMHLSLRWVHFMVSVVQTPPWAIALVPMNHLQLPVLIFLMGGGETLKSRYITESTRDARSEKGRPPSSSRDWWINVFCVNSDSFRSGQPKSPGGGHVCLVHQVWGWGKCQCGTHCNALCFDDRRRRGECLHKCLIRYHSLELCWDFARRGFSVRFCIMCNERWFCFKVDLLVKAETKTAFIFGVVIYMM